MSPYRSEIEKLYNRIVKIVSKGESYLQNYYDMIDELIENRKYGQLEDVLKTKFKIDLRTYQNIDILKKNSFKIISGQLESSTNLNLKSLYTSKGVYTMGTQFFDINTTQYLGDIKQYDTLTLSQCLEVYTFAPELMRNAISKFVPSPNLTLNYKKDSVLYYNTKLYLCSKDYIWSKDNRITPTFSEYWTEIYPGTQSLHYVMNKELTLLERYGVSIDILRNYYYIDYSNNTYTEANYIDEYFE